MKQIKFILFFLILTMKFAHSSEIQDFNEWKIKFKIYKIYIKSI